MSKVEEYTAKAAASLAAVEASTNARDRAFHARAHGIWRKLIAGVGAAEQRAAVAPAKTATPVFKDAREPDRTAKQGAMAAFGAMKRNDR